jgi:phosphoribosylanthranilate isomerase
MVKVKICGVTSASDAKICVESGADFIGTIVNIPKSPRTVSPEQSKNIVASLPASVKGIIVMTPKSIEEVKEAAELIKPFCVQLHGHEDPEFVKEAKRELSCGIIKVIHVGGDESIEEALKFSEICDAILLETPSKALGGSGKTHDWDTSSKIAREAKCHVFLAGGLNPENVKRASEIVQPYCVDVSSGVERKPGLKEPDKVRKFIEVAKDSN